MSTIEKTDAAEIQKRSPVHGCRFCDEPLESLVVDLGLSPLCQSQIEPQDLNKHEIFYPLKAFVCQKCWLVQVHEHVSGEEIFSHYAYFSSFSDSWLAHAAAYVDMITDRLGLGADSHVVELASNDGYLLQNFVRKNISCLGIEPATNVAQAAIEKGVPVLNKFFGVETAKGYLADGGSRASLIIANNVLAHVPDLNDFVAGMKVLLDEGGTINVEFPHVLNMIELNQFDTIYQEHYCYLGLLTLEKVFGHHGMTIFDVDEIPTHGGSLRIYVRAQEENPVVSENVDRIRKIELDRGLTDLTTYEDFAKRVEYTKWNLLEFLINAKREGKNICAYGAPGKGNTLLNYCGIRSDLIDYTVDRNPFKQNSYLVGSRIPVYAPGKIEETRPDYVLVLPWNLKTELTKQLDYVKQWGGKLVFAIPELEIVE